MFLYEAILRAISIFQIHPYDSGAYALGIGSLSCLAEDIC
jgi:hypothetical protein